MIESFARGALAGYGIAIPVGAIAVLIIDSSVRRGFRHGFAAGAGAASADLIYAALAAGAGSILAPLLAPAASAIGLLSGLILLAIAVSGLRSLASKPGSERRPDEHGHSAGRTFVRFTMLTIVNPMTVVYFSALLLGGDLSSEPASLIPFVVGAFLASLSWQTLLAILGSWAHVATGLAFRRATGYAGNLVILALALSTLTRAWL